MARKKIARLTGLAEQPVRFRSHPAVNFEIAGEVTRIMGADLLPDLLDAEVRGCEQFLCPLHPQRGQILRW
jgi:hypothetical protein